MTDPCGRRLRATATRPATTGTMTRLSPANSEATRASRLTRGGAEVDGDSRARSGRAAVAGGSVGGALALARARPRLLARHRSRRLGYAESAGRHAERQPDRISTRTAAIGVRFTRSAAGTTHATSRPALRQWLVRSNARSAAAPPDHRPRSASVPASADARSAAGRPPPTAGSTPSYSSRPKTPSCDERAGRDQDDERAVESQVDEGQLAPARRRAPASRPPPRR